VVTRRWTLQEILGPRRLKLDNKDWYPLTSFLDNKIEYLTTQDTYPPQIHCNGIGYGYYLPPQTRNSCRIIIRTHELGRSQSYHKSRGQSILYDENIRRRERINWVTGVAVRLFEIGYSRDWLVGLDYSVGDSNIHCLIEPVGIPGTTSD